MDDVMASAVRLVLGQLGAAAVWARVDGYLVSVSIVAARRTADLGCGHRVRRGQIAGRIGDGTWRCLDCVIGQLRTSSDGRMAGAADLRIQPIVTTI